MEKTKTQLHSKYCSACKCSNSKGIRKQSTGKQSASQADCKGKSVKKQKEEEACLAEHFAEYRESHSIRKPGSVTFRLLSLLTKKQQKPCC